MKLFGILGIATAAALTVGAADIQLSGMTGNAKAGTFKLYAKNRTAESRFAIVAMPITLSGGTIVSAPTLNPARRIPSRSISRPGFTCWSRTAARSLFRKIGRKPTRSSPGATASPTPSM